MLTPALIKKIDQARKKGATPHDLAPALEKQGLDPDEVFDAYSRLPLPDGTPRGEANLGEP